MDNLKHPRSKRRSPPTEPNPESFTQTQTTARSCAQQDPNLGSKFPYPTTTPQDYLDSPRGRPKDPTFPPQKKLRKSGTKDLQKRRPRPEAFLTKKGEDKAKRQRRPAPSGTGQQCGGSEARRLLKRELGGGERVHHWTGGIWDLGWGIWGLGWSERGKKNIPRSQTTRETRQEEKTSTLLL
jgi:hypothetical protein